MSTRDPHRVLALILTTLTALSGCGDDETSATGTTGSGASGAQGGAGGGGAQGGQGATGGGGSGGEGGGTQAVEISFQGNVGSTVFDCAATYPGLGTAATEVALRDFRLYVHDVRLVEAGTGTEVPVVLTSDGAWQYSPEGGAADEGTALLDFENNAGSCVNGTAEMNDTVIGTVAAGTYDGVRFKVGVPAALNHADVAVAPSPLNLSAMFWSWNGGYKFVRIDSAPVGQPSPFNLHLGSTGCTGDPSLGEMVTCTNANRPEIAFESFDPATDRIVIDYAAIVAGADLTVDQGGAPGCMSGIADPECVEPFAALGLSLETGEPVATQAAFRVE